MSILAFFCGRSGALTRLSNRDSSTRFQLPKILPSDFGPREGTQAGDETLHEEVDSDKCSSPAGDSSVLLSDLLDHLEEAAARSPGPTPNSTFSPSSGISIYYSAGEETGAETDTDSLFRVTGPVVTPEESPPLDVNTPGCTVSQEYKELVEDFPLSATGETVTTGKKSIDTQSVASFVFDAGIEANPPVTPKNKQRKHSSPAPVLSPGFLGPFPTPFAHRQFIASSPSGSLRSPSSSSPSRDPSSPSQRPKLNLRKRAATRSRLHLSDLFKRQEATKP